MNLLLPAAADGDDDTGCCILKLQFGELHASDMRVRVLFVYAGEEIPADKRVSLITS